MRYWLLAALCCFIMAWVLPDVASAHVNGDTLLDEVADKFEDAAAKWQPKIKTHALNLLWLLAAIEFIWSGIFLVLRGADIQEFVTEICRRILILGFFLAVLEHSSVWARAITDSFLAVAQDATGAAGGQKGLSPGVIFNMGLLFADRITDSYSSWNPIDRLGIKISAYFIVICFSLIASQVLITLVEMYLVTSAGIILLGFGGTAWTKSYATAYFRYLFAVATKLFVIQLLVGLCEGFVSDWLKDIENEEAQITIMIGAAMVILSLVRHIPQLAASLLRGAQLGRSWSNAVDDGNRCNMTRAFSEQFTRVGNPTISPVQEAVKFAQPAGAFSMAGGVIARDEPMSGQFNQHTTVNNTKLSHTTKPTTNMNNPGRR